MQASANQCEPRMTDDILPTVPPDFAVGNRQVIIDYYIPKNVKDEIGAFRYKVFNRLNAKKIKFSNVSFEHSVFDGCYFHTCVFDS